MYAIVRFVDESDAPGIVCSHWITDDGSVSSYPNVRTNEARDKLLKRLATPEKNWSSCRIRVLHKYNTFSQATLHLRQAEDTSTLESDEEIVADRPRKRIRTSLKYPGEDSDEDFSPPPSQKQTSIPYPVPPSIGSSTFHQPQISLSPCISSAPPASSSKQAIMTGKLVAWMTEISEKMKLVEDKINLVLENQQKLLSRQHQVAEIDNSDESYEILGKLPVCDDGSFMELNSKLEEKPLQNLLIKVLISVGGKDMRFHIYNMLKRVLDDDVAELYSLSGKSSSKNIQKKSFLATTFWRIIFSACRRLYNEATELNVKEAVGDWLNQAKVRKIRRLQRIENIGRK